MGTGSTETHRAEDACHEGGVVVFHRGVGILTHLGQLGHEIETQHIGFGFLEGVVLVSQSLADGTFTRDGVLDAHAVGGLVEHYVGKESVKLDVFQRLRGHQLLGDGVKDLVELSLHSVLELEFAGATLQLHTLIVRQVDGDGLAVCVAVAGIVNHVVSSQVNIRARNFFLIFGRHRQLLLQYRHERSITGQLLGPLLVLDKDEGFMRGLDAIAGVGVVLDGANHQVDVVVAHIHPLHVALKVIVGTESLGTEFQIGGKLLVASQLGGFIEQGSSLLNWFGEVVVIPHAFQSAILVADNHGVLTGLVRVVEGIPLLLGHVSGIELCACGFGANAVHERFVAIKAVPRAVGDGSQFLDVGIIADSGHQFVLDTIVLVPEEAIHDVGSFEEQSQHLALVVAEMVDVGCQGVLGVLV